MRSAQRSAPKPATIVAPGYEPVPSRYSSARTFLDTHAPTLTDRAWARIKASEADYGDSFLWTARRHLVRELEEEIIDAAAWAALISERIERDPDSAPGNARERATALLAAIATASAKTDLLIAQLRPLIERQV